MRVANDRKLRPDGNRGPDPNRLVSVLLYRPHNIRNHKIIGISLHDTFFASKVYELAADSSPTVDLCKPSEKIWV